MITFLNVLPTARLMLKNWDSASPHAKILQLGAHCAYRKARGDRLLAKPEAAGINVWRPISETPPPLYSRGEEQLE